MVPQWMTLVVHPGPPGDAGPSSLDWALLGDTGLESNSYAALSTLLTTSSSDWTAGQRSHWGTIVFQANEHLDGGAIWAWEQYALPALGSITKAQLYQSLHSQGAMTALITAIIRVYKTTHLRPKVERVRLTPRDDWQLNSVTHQCPFLGGKTHERPLLQSKMRKPDFAIHTAEDVLRIARASDSQPGAQLAPLTNDSKTSLFAYGAHLHGDAATVPQLLYTSLGYKDWQAIPNGTIIGQRHGAIFVKTRPTSDCSAGVWITHGRIPKKAGTPLESKIPMTQAIIASGHGRCLAGVLEWEQGAWEERPGTWQEVYVRTVVAPNAPGMAQCVYWDFYNGAFSTRQCQMLLEALHWAVDPDRGDARVLALMVDHLHIIVKMKANSRFRAGHTSPMALP